MWCEALGEVHLKGDDEVACLSFVFIDGESLPSEADLGEVLCERFHYQFDTPGEGVDGRVSSQ